jgi:hypothetical protein
MVAIEDLYRKDSEIKAKIPDLRHKKRMRLDGQPPIEPPRQVFLPFPGCSLPVSLPAFTSNAGNEIVR